MSTLKSMQDRPRLTSFEACLLNIAATLERPLTLATIQAAQTGADGDLTIRDIVAVAQNTGLQAGYGERHITKFDETLAPALLLMVENKAVVYHGRAKNGALLVFDPDLGEGIGEVSEEQLTETHTGYAVLFRRNHTDELDAGNAPYRGHWFRAALSANRWTYIQVALAAALANLLAYRLQFSLWSSMTVCCPMRQPNRSLP